MSGGVEEGGDGTDLRAPVSYMVNTIHIMTAKLEDAADAVTDDCRSQMPHMHLLCYIRRREVDDDPLYITWRRKDAVLYKGVDPGGEPIGG